MNFLKWLENCQRILKVAIRNIRRDGIEKVKKLEKEKNISQDESKKYQNDIEKITSEFIKTIEDAYKQ